MSHLPSTSRPSVHQLAGALTAVFVGALITTGQSQPNLPPATISASIPVEVDAPVVVSANPIARFDDFSWRSFIALNRPAKAGARGQADSTKSIGDLTAARVWETWKADYELYQPKGKAPSSWSSFVTVTPCQQPDAPAAANSERILGSFSKLGGLNQAGFGSEAGPLIAQNKTFARYEFRLNEREYEFMRNPAKPLYLAANLPGAGQASLSFPVNSIAVKAAWLDLTDETIDVQKRYYVVKARVVDPSSGSCATKSMGLVGFHIVQKTGLRPQWVWSSFEHIDNVPDVSLSGRFAFNDGAPLRQSLIPPDGPPPITAADLSNPTPMQVVRLHPVADTPVLTTAETNRSYRHALAGTVWENYKLVMTQWPTEPAASGGSPFPSEADPQPPIGTANTVMETYFQDPGTSCMACHDLARSRRVDFEWFVLTRAFAPDAPVTTLARGQNKDAAPPPMSVRAEAQSALKAFAKQHRR